MVILDIKKRNYNHYYAGRDELGSHKYKQVKAVRTNVKFEDMSWSTCFVHFIDDMFSVNEITSGLCFSMGKTEEEAIAITAQALKESTNLESALEQVEKHINKHGISPRFKITYKIKTKALEPAGCRPPINS